MTRNNCFLLITVFTLTMGSLTVHAHGANERRGNDRYDAPDYRQDRRRAEAADRESEAQLKYRQYPADSCVVADGVIKLPSQIGDQPIHQWGYRTEKIEGFTSVKSAYEDAYDDCQVLQLALKRPSTLVVGRCAATVHDYRVLTVNVGFNARLYVSGDGGPLGITKVFTSGNSSKYAEEISLLQMNSALSECQIKRASHIQESLRRGIPVIQKN